MGEGRAKAGALAMKHGDRVTFVSGTRPCLEQGRVVEVVDTSMMLAFRVRDVPFTTLAFFTNVEHEGITWIPGWLRPWWPPDRRRGRALLTAHALGDAHVVMKAPSKPFDVGERLANDFDKIFDDLERALGRLDR